MSKPKFRIGQLVVTTRGIVGDCGARSLNAGTLVEVQSYRQSDGVITFHYRAGGGNFRTTSDAIRALLPSERLKAKGVFATASFGEPVKIT